MVGETDRLASEGRIEELRVITMSTKFVARLHSRAQLTHDTALLSKYSSLQ
jgi:hypothetical protein